jgi:DNA-binding transcriptional regulator WhiA
MDSRHTVFSAANARRRVEAGRRDAESAETALEVLGQRCRPGHRVVAEARIADPEASWADIGQRLGITKDQAVGRFRRMLAAASVRDDDQVADYLPEGIARALLADPQGFGVLQ